MIIINFFNKRRALTPNRDCLVVANRTEVATSAQLLQSTVVAERLTVVPDVMSTVVAASAPLLQPTVVAAISLLLQPTATAVPSAHQYRSEPLSHFYLIIDWRFFLLHFKFLEKFTVFTLSTNNKGTH